MNYKKINIWYLSSLLISIAVAIPIITVFSSFFQSTGNYSSILKDTFLYDYIFNFGVRKRGEFLSLGQDQDNEQKGIYSYGGVAPRRKKFGLLSLPQ